MITDSHIILYLTERDRQLSLYQVHKDLLYQRDLFLGRFETGHFKSH
jgi:hypothetical protein